MTADIVIRANDDRPILRRTLLKPDQATMDLTGVDSVRINITDPVSGNILVDQPCVISDASNGVVEYTWADVPDAGLYFAVFKVADGSSSMTFPNHIPITLFVSSSNSWEFSYTGDPSSRNIDAVRFLIQDTDIKKALLTDKEIEYLVSENGNVYSASADAAMMMANYYTNLLDKRVGPLSIRYGEVSKRFIEMANHLRRRAARKASPRPVNTAEDNSEQMFDIGMHDYPGSLLPPWQDTERGATI